MLYLIEVKTILALLGLGILIFDGFLFVNPNKGMDANFYFNLAYGLIYLLGAIVSFIRIKKYPYSPNMKRALTFFGIGMFSYGAGLIVWTYFNLVARIAVPYPSLADVFFILFYPGIIAGTFFLLQSFGGKITTRLVVEGVITLLVFFTILYLFLNQTSQGTSVSSLAKILNILYPFGDAFITSLAVTALRTEKGISEHPNILYFVFAFILAAAADTIFSFRSANSLYWNGDISDLLFAISGFLIVWGILSIKIPSLTDHSLS